MNKIYHSTHILIMQIYEKSLQQPQSNSQERKEHTMGPYFYIQ